MLPAKRLKLNENVEEKSAQTRNASRNAALLKSIESFTTDLYKCIADHEKENLVCSGLSVHLVLSMCALGAQENTARQMLAALHLTKDNLSEDFQNVITRFESVPHIELNVANRIFTDKSIVVKNSFKQNVSDFFSSDVIDVDFGSESEKAVVDINNWCAEKTEDKIKQLLSKDDVDSDTKVILTNAVYFKACWLDPFFSHNTENEPFYIDKDATINVPTMHQRNSFMYKDLKRYKAECIAIPYRNRDYLFVIIKPKEIDGFENLQNNLHKIQLNFDNRLGKKCDFDYDFFHLALPKFKIESRVDLNEHLSMLGMVEMFTGLANFKGISEEPELTPPLHVDKVLQKAFIEVNEEGTEAGAATYVTIRGGGTPQWRDFKVDRPFLYRIVNKTCNLTLFSGRVIKPTYD